MKKDLVLKYAELKDRIRVLGKAAIAFSGGSDSSLLLYAAVSALGENVIAVTAVSDIRHREETERARQTAGKTGVKHFIVETEELSIPEVRNNLSDRCYHCKRQVFSKIIKIAGENGISSIIEGSNCDDVSKLRPGFKAIQELGIKSPLVGAGFSKKEVTETLKHLDTDISDTPGESCLMTRFPYNEIIDNKKLSRVRQAEEFFKGIGYSHIRVRTYDDLARIEVPGADINGLLRNNKEEIVDRMKALGYKYITVDIEGFRSGSMDK